MLDLDPAGQRLAQLLDMEDRSAAQRAVGQERFPFVGKVVPEIGDERVIPLLPQIGRASARSS